MTAAIFFENHRFFQGVYYAQHIDEARFELEAATGGKNTLLLDDAGLPLRDGTHPGL